MGRNYQRGVEPWEISPKSEKPGRESREAVPKTDRQRRKARERRYQCLLFAMIVLPLGLGLTHLLLEDLPFSLQGGFQNILKLEVLKLDGLFYRLFQVCSAMSCFAAWLACQVPVAHAVAHAVGLLLLPGLLLLGWLLLSFKAEYGYKLMMAELVLTELIMGLYLLFSIAFALLVAHNPNAVLQAAYYLCLFLYPLVELLVLRKWKENIY